MSQIIPSLPADLVEFLRSAKALTYDAKQCECGSVTLCGVDELASEEIEVLFINYFPVVDDPHEDDEGDYVTSAVNLVASCQEFEPEHILSWFPEIASFGSYDIDHGHVNLFPGKTWADIVKDPLPYLNAQWREDGIAEKAMPTTPGIRWAGKAPKPRRGKR